MRKSQIIILLCFIFCIVGTVVFLDFENKVHGFVISPISEIHDGDVQDFDDIFDNDSENFALVGNGSILDFEYFFGEQVRLNVNPRSGYYSINCFSEGDYINFVNIIEESNLTYDVPVDCQENLKLKIFYFSSFVEDDSDDFIADDMTNDTETNSTEINDTESSETFETFEDEINESFENNSEDDFNFSAGDIITGDAVLGVDGEIYEIVVYGDAGGEEFGAEDDEFGTFGENGTAVDDSGNVFQCGTINESGIYVFNQSFSSSGNCIIIEANDVTLDFDGFNIDGSGSGSGVYVDGYNGTTIKDGRIDPEGFEAGSSGIYFNLCFNNIVENMSIFVVPDPISINLCQNSTIKNSVLSSGWQMGIYVVSSSENTLINNIVSSGESVPIYLYSIPNSLLINNTATSSGSSAGFLVGANSTLINNTAYSNSGGGFGVGENSTLINNNASGNGGLSGVGFSVGANSILTDNIASGNYGFGFEIGANSTLTNNTASNNGESGFYFSSSSNSILINNTAYGNEYFGFYFKNSSYNNLTSNIANENSVGIYFELNSSYNNLTSNIANDNSGAGIYFKTSSSNNTIINNTVNENSGTGITLDSSSNNTIINNTINDNDNEWEGYGIYSDSGSQNLIENNNFESNRCGVSIGGDDNVICGNNFESNNHGVQLHGDNNFILNNGISGSGYELIRVGGDNNTIENNIMGSSGYGFYFEYAFGNNLTNNSISSIGYGFYLYGSDNNILENNLVELASDYGIYFENSDNNIIKDSNVSDNYKGLCFDNSDNNILENTSIEFSDSSGIYFINSDNNSIEDNNVSNNFESGIYLELSPNTTMRNNNVSGNGYNFGIYGTQNSHLYNDIDRTNIVDYSYKIFYNFSLSNYVFDLSFGDAGVVVCADCENVTYKNGNLSHYNWEGIHFFNTSNSFIFNTSIHGNSQGVFVVYSSNNTLENNSIYDCSDSCLYVRGSDNVFENNSINLSGGYGIRIYSSGSSDESSNNLFKNTNMTNIAGTSVFLDDRYGSSNLNNTFLNFIYESESVDSNSELIRKWYLDVNVKDVSGVALSGASVSVTNVSEVVSESGLSDSNGSAGWELLGYVRNETGIYSSSNWTLDISLSGYDSDSQEFNLSENLIINSTLLSSSSSPAANDDDDSDDSSSSSVPVSSREDPNETEDNKTIHDLECIDLDDYNIDDILADFGDVPFCSLVNKSDEPNIIVKIRKDLDVPKIMISSPSGEPLVEIFDGRKLDVPFLNISFIDSNFNKSDLSHCYNSVLDFGEDDIDCGGFCGECIDKSYFMSWLDKVMYWIGY